ncbi:ATP-dependent DNA helicase [Trichonephila clavipes]|nr:ATP-dependent DNA helicase [Trichonephila clavipes]
MDELNLDQAPQDINKEFQHEFVRLQAFVAATDPAVKKNSLVRGLGEIIVPSAWTGIVAIILEGDRTEPLRFKLPVPILDNSSCSIRHSTKKVSFLKATKIIVWDECTIIPHYTFSLVGRLFRELMGLDLPFGGKVFVLGVTGDRFHLLHYMQTEQLLLRLA